MDSKVSKVARNLENSNIGYINPENLTTASELAEICTKFKNNKAPGFDNIHNIVLKNMPMSLFSTLATIFNTFISKGIFPDVFKRAMVIPVPEKGKDLRLPAVIDLLVYLVL